MKKQKNPYIVPITIAVIIVLVVFAKDIAGLFESEFKQNLEALDDINEKFDTNLYSFPATIEADELLLDELNVLKHDETEEAFGLVLGIRRKLVESDIFFKEGWKHGRGSTTKWGFGCREGLPRLTNTTSNRNMSSQIGYEAVSLMNEMIEDYPKEAKIANVTLKRALFLNASFFEEEKSAERDITIIRTACVKKE